jgi:hypothetical protein
MYNKPFLPTITKWIAEIFLAYVLVCLVLMLMQRNLIYFPDSTAFVPADWKLSELQPFDVKSNGLELRSWYTAPKEPGNLTVVFFQGNAGGFGLREHKIRKWLDAGLGVLLVGYPNYGNPGSPSEQGLYGAARAAIDAVLAKGTTPSELVLYGESLGSGVAVEMATKYPARALILEGAFTSLADVGAKEYWWVPVDLLLKDKFDSLSKIGRVHTPLLMLHGEDDNIVPLQLDKELFAAANEPKEEIIFPGAGHNNLYDFGAWEVIQKFLIHLPEKQ